MADGKFYGYITAPPAPPANPKGFLRSGNTNIYDRPIVPNGRNSSTVRSVSYGLPEGEVLMPSVSDGEDGRPPHLLSIQPGPNHTPSETLQYYNRYHKSLGTFANPDDADAYGQALHEQQAQLQNFGGRTVLPPLIHPMPEPQMPPTPTLRMQGLPALPTPSLLVNRGK